LVEAVLMGKPVKRRSVQVLGAGGEGPGLVDRLAHFAHDHLLWLLLACYALAALLPAPGLWLRDVTFTQLGAGAGLTLPMALLALLLFNAGLGVQVTQLCRLATAPGILLAGLAANLLVPVLGILVVSWGLRGWHDPDGLQVLLVGLTLVASMPVAGSSAAWSQNANGDLALSLGLVLGSTLLSPLTTPAVLELVGCLAYGIQTDTLGVLAGSGTGLFLATFVLLPSLLGLLARRRLGEEAVARSKPALKLVNSAILVVLNYVNAAASLPQVVAAPDWGFLTLALAVVLALCVLTFSAGWLLARSLGGGPGQQAALMFGLGMNNNGTGLVLASVALAHLPGVVLPLILSTLMQHVVAGAASHLTSRPAPAAEPLEPRRPLPLRPHRGEQAVSSARSGGAGLRQPPGCDPAPRAVCVSTLSFAPRSCPGAGADGGPTDA
jgi:BASS family bile acid:Na+ symporter